MSPDRAYLRDMLEAARLALPDVSGKTRSEFPADTQCQDAVIRRVEIVGKAAQRVSEPTRRAFSDLPWNEMVEMRNVMVHDYDDLDPTIVWDTVQQDLPPLLIALEELDRNWLER